jgi:predicted nucleic acid-binding protein
LRVLLDASCLVAVALPQHEHHAATVADLTRRRSAGQSVVMAAHAVLEAFAVLTRLPPPHRLAPADALAVLDRNFGKAETAALSGAEAWRLVRREAASGTAGGRIYDRHIAACAVKADVDEILTWNVRHFAGMTAIRAVSPTAD